MIRIAIVDDESIILNGIVRAIPWGNEFELAGKAQDGKTALELLRAERPDLVLLDIHMPNMNGLEVIEAAKKLHPEMKFVILSGYDDFGYAQRACGMGALDYILKPTKKSVLLETVQKAAALIEAERSQTVKIRDLEQLARNLTPMIQEHLLLKLIHGIPVKPGQYGQVLGMMKGEAYRVIVLALDSETSKQAFLPEDHLKYVLKPLAESLFVPEVNKWVAHDINGYVAIILRAEEGRDDLLERCEQFLRAIGPETGATCSIGVGGPYKGAPGISLSYAEALGALKRRFLTGASSIVAIEDVTRENDHEIWIQLFAKEREILTSLLRGDREAAFEQLRQYYALLERGEDLPKISFRISELLNTVWPCMSNINPGAYNSSRQAGIIQAVEAAHNFGEIKEYVSGFLNRCLEEIASFNRENTNSIIRKAVEIMKEQYASDVTVNDLAQRLFLTPNYFSRLFKKTTGDSCKEYLLKIRIAKAKELLKQGTCKNYEVSEMTGFNDPNYFSSCFKKYEGISPTEYRNKYMLYGDAE